MPTAAYFENAQSDNGTDVHLWLLTITHADLPETIRLVRDKVAVISRGNTFNPFPFDITPPGDGEDGPTAARIVIDNIDKRIVETVRALATAPTLLIEAVMRSAPNTVEEAFPPYQLSAVQGDRMALQADLVDDDDDAEPVMRWTFTPGLAPAIFS